MCRESYFVNLSLARPILAFSIKALKVLNVTSELSHYSPYLSVIKVERMPGNNIKPLGS
jgi:hypothetical protein